MPVVLPTFDVETAMLAAGSSCIIAIDEVGRGALAGPVTVGVAIVDARTGPMPEGLRDSKLLSEPRREAMAPLASSWVARFAVGEATAAEIDEIGIVASLGVAGRRAISDLLSAGADVSGATVLLDGSHDWLTPALLWPLQVRVRPKADRDCAAVAAASVIAKVHRDTVMRGWHEQHPQYEWAGNKGYGSATHLAAIAEHGPSDLHRRTWLRAPA